MRGISDDAGAWRTKTVPPLADGTVPPPHWLVPFETETYVGRLALGADDPAPLALARAIARLVRLQPFPAATAASRGWSRTCSPTAAACRRSCSTRAHGAPTAPRCAPRSPATRRRWRAFRNGARPRARAPARRVEPVDELRPLADFATEGGTDRLYKAAQRGRLRVVRRDGRLFTTAPWVAAYAAQPSSEIRLNAEKQRKHERTARRVCVDGDCRFSGVATYSGGLGVLAGDVIRAAADAGYPMAGVTLLYRDGYFRQHLDAAGAQHEEPQSWRPDSVLEALPPT